MLVCFRCAVSVAALLLTIAVPVLAQTGVVEGIVRDGAGHEPIPGVHVLIAGTLSGTATDENGSFLLTGLKDGPIGLQFSSIGFSTVSQRVVVSDVRTTLSVVLEPEFMALPNVEVVSNRSLAERRTPASFTTIQTEDLKLTQPLGTEEALRSIPGVHVASDDGISNRTNIGIRGLYPRRSEKILLLEDGVPIQPALYLAPSAYYNPPTERLDAIEVIKNATNVRFGAGSLVGTVNYVTRRPPVNPSGIVSVTGGSNGYLSTLAAYGGSALNGRLGGEVQLLYKQSDGFRDNNVFDLYNATAKAIFRPTPRTTISFKGNLHKEDAQATYAALTPYMYEEDASQNPFAHDWLETARLAGDLNMEHTIGSDVVLLGTAYANRFRRDWWRQSNTLIPATISDPGADEDALVRIGVDANRARLRTFKVLGIAPRIIASTETGTIKHTIEIGARYHRDVFDNVEIDTDRNDARVADFDAATFDNASDPNGKKRTKQQFTADAIAFYVQDGLSLGNLGITAGIRLETYRQTEANFYDRAAQMPVDDYKEVRQTEVIPALGFTYVLASGTVFGGVFRGFVPLTSSFAFTTLIDDEGFEVSGNLENEMSTNFELGFRTSEDALLTGTFAAFSNTISNLVAAGRRANFQPVIGNLGEVRYNGLEFSGRFRANRAIALPFMLTIDGSATVLRSNIRQGLIDEEGTTDGVDVTGNAAPYAPELIARVGASASVAGFDLTVHFNHVGSQFADYNNTVEETPAGDNGLLPSYRFIDAGFRYHVPDSPVQLTFAVKNLTNNVYKGSRLHRSSSGIFPSGFRQVNVGISLDL